jgi:heptosyltransferase-2
MGDLVLVTPLLRALRRRHPSAHVALVTKREYAPLFAQSPRLDEVIAWDTGASLLALARRLRSGRYTHCLDLHGSLRARALRLLVGGRWVGYPKHRLARTVLIRAKRDLYRDRRPVAERYFDAARDLDVRPDGGPPEVFLHTDAVRAADRFLADYGLGRERTLIALAPGAAHATKRWPERHWHALVRNLVETGKDVVLLGGRADQPLAARLAESGAPRAASAAGLFDLQGTGALLRRARAAVGGDTGVMHLATAVGAPVVVLLGPTVGAFGFLPYQARATIVERNLPCRPCSRMGGDRCPLGHHACLETITADEVLESLRRLPQ